MVYTALLGGYEDLSAQPLAATSELEFICFTDDPDLVSDDWRIVLIEPRIAGDSVRSQREIKIMVHRYLAGYEESLYIDNSIELVCDPTRILDEWLHDADHAVSQHSYRERLHEEFDEVIRLNYDDATRVHEQLWTYAHFAPDLLERRPVWNAIIARRHVPAVFEAMEVWWEHVLRYSRRDQLSALFALREPSLRLKVLELDNFESEYHRWVISSSRKARLGKRPVVPAGPALVDKLRFERLEDRASHLSAENERLLRSFHQLESDHATLQSQHQVESERAREFVDQLTRRVDAMEASFSWRVTSPMRKTIGMLRRLSRGSQA